MGNSERSYINSKIQNMNYHKDNILQIKTKLRKKVK